MVAILCNQLGSGCIQPVSNGSSIFLIFHIFLPGNHGLLVGLTAVVTWNNSILSHCMLPVTESSFCEGFPVLPRFCSKKSTWITVRCISLFGIFKPMVQFVPLRAKTTMFISFSVWLEILSLVALEFDLVQQQYLLEDRLLHWYYLS